MAQRDPLTTKNDGATGRVPAIFAAGETVRADRQALGGLTTTGLTTGDACQILTKDTATAAVNSTASPVVGIYEGNSSSLVTRGVVAANFAAGPTTVGETLYLSSTAGQLTNVKPTKDYVHEVGQTVDVANKLVDVRPRFLVQLPLSPPLSLWVAAFGSKTRQYLSPAWTDVGEVDIETQGIAALWDGDYIWTASNENPARVRKYDPLTRTQVAGPYSLGYLRGSNPTSTLVFDGTYYWIPNGNTTITQFNAAGGTVRTVNTTGQAHFIPYDGAGGIMVPERFGSTVRRFSTADGSLKGSVVLGGTIGGNGVIYNDPVAGERYFYLPYWDSGAPYTARLAKIRINLDGTLTTLATNSMGWNSGSLQPCCTDGTYLWTISDNTHLAKNRLSDGGLIGNYVLPTGGACQQPIYDSGFIWVTQSAGSRVKKVDPATGGYVDCISVTAGTYGIATTKQVLPYP